MLRLLALVQHAQCCCASSARRVRKRKIGPLYLTLEPLPIRPIQSEVMRQHTNSPSLLPFPVSPWKLRPWPGEARRLCSLS